MANYAAQFNRTASATLALGAVVANATTPRRGGLYDYKLGSEAAAADNNYLYTIDRVSGVPAGTGITLPPLDPADAAALASGIEALSGNGTVGLNVDAIPLNQRATFRSAASPGGQIIWPATAGNGLLVQTPTAGGLVAITGMWHFEEK